MASDVVRGGRIDPRSFRTLGLVQFAILSVVAVAVAAGGTGSSGSPSPALFFFGVAVFVLWSWWWVLPQVSSSWVVEIDRDAVRWRGGLYQRDRVVRRAQVQAAGSAKNARRMELRFYDTAGRQVGMLPLFKFPPGQVMAALRRHGWPVPELEDFVDSLSRWR